MNKIKYITPVLLFTASLSSFSQEDDNSLGALITDRPDATESPSTIPVGYIQVETGAFYESFEDNNIKNETYTYNTTLVRLGLLDYLELRIGWDFVESKFNGFDDDVNEFNPSCILIICAKALSNEYSALFKIVLVFLLCISNIFGLVLESTESSDVVDKWFNSL